eukprot:FR734989.1.p1 GENE.FR734989.1~~FR734989.1.p1  ORF type:complete len:258 (+),score=13.69 FR734989.1:43-774(+)
MLFFFGALLGTIGIWLYDKIFWNYKWPLLFMITTTLGAFFSLMQLLLCYQWTFGLPNIVFATGDVSLQGALANITFMPSCIMFLSMIPKGVEGTLYALITTWQNVAAEVGYDLGTLLECPISITNDDLENGNWGNLKKLTWITSLIQVLPAFFVYASYKGVRVLPDNQDQTKEQRNPKKTSKMGALLFHILFYGSIICSVFETVYRDFTTQMLAELMAIDLPHNSPFVSEVLYKLSYRSAHII